MLAAAVHRLKGSELHLLRLDSFLDPFIEFYVAVENIVDQ